MITFESPIKKLLEIYRMIKVAVLMGGYSDESQVSLKSGKLVLDHLDKTKYEVYNVQVLTTGWHCVINDIKYVINKGDFSFTLNGETIKLDVVYNTIHGTPGEDGHIQAYFEILAIPYTGCGFYQSAITFNKKDCIAVLNKYDIPSAKSFYLNKNEPIDLALIIKTVGMPCFVKPNKSGSSLGVSKVYEAVEFEAALAKAFNEDSEVLIESFLDGTEVSIGVLNYNQEVRVLEITEILSENDFFDYEAKYEGKSKEITPARLSTEVSERVRAMAIKCYKSLNMVGFSRTDFIIVGNEPYFIEMNTLPGLSPQSIFPQQAKIAGIELKDLFTNEINLAFNRKKTWEI